MRKNFVVILLGVLSILAVAIGFIGSVREREPRNLQQLLQERVDAAPVAHRLGICYTVFDGDLNQTLVIPCTPELLKHLAEMRGR